MNVNPETRSESLAQALKWSQQRGATDGAGGHPSPGQILDTAERFYKYLEGQTEPKPEVPRRGRWILMDRDWREVYVLETGHLAGTPDPLHLTTPLGDLPRPNTNTAILDSVRYAYRVGTPDSAYIAESYQDRDTATARERVLVFRKLSELDAEVRRLAETF